MNRRRRGRYPGNGPFRDLPPWQRPGRIYGYGVGSDRGNDYLGDPSKCGRFPWLTRWWWSNPEQSGTVPLPPRNPTSAEEKQFLEDQVKFLEEELSKMKKRINESSSKQETS